jgi:type IV pilus biogenesis protein CpaD/CtpE
MKHFLYLFVVAALSGCATTPPVAPEVVIKERAEKRWQHLIKGEVDESYAYLSPATRLVMTKDAYRGGLKPGMWKDAKVAEVKCEQNLCKVELDIDIRVRMRGAGFVNHKSRITELWRGQDGGWWFVPSQT